MKKSIKNIFIIVFLLTAQFLSAQDTLDMIKVEKSIDKIFINFSDENPGVVLTVMKKGEIAFSKAYGLANIKDKKELEVHQLFNLRELSKVFTSLAIMKLVEKNKLDLEDNLCDIYKGFPEYGQKVRVKHLLNQTSGLKPFNEKEINSNVDVLDFLTRQDGVLFEPGTVSKYSNSEYAMLANIIEMKSGMSYSDYLKKNIFKKLQMNNTYFAHELNESNNLAIGHFINDKNIYDPELMLHNLYGEQGIFTNAQDYAKWDKALYTNKLLRCDCLKEIFTIIPLNSEKNNHYYGSGWVLMKRNNTRYYWHGGMGMGYTNLVLHLPDTKTTILLLTNRNKGYDYLKMAIDIARLFDKDLKL